MYHTVSDERLSHFRHVYFHKNAQKFEDDLIHIKRHYHLGDWELLHDSTRRRRPLRKPLAFITFDDGMSECFNVVRPLLLKHSIPCCFFIRTAFVDNLRMFYRHKASLCIERVHTATQARQRELLRTVSRDSWPGLNSLESFTQWVKGLTFRDEDQIDQLCELLAVDVNRYLSEHRPYMTQEQIRQLAADGFAIGGHGRKHAPLGELDNAEELESEIVESCRFAARLADRDRVPFSFPFSASNVDRPQLKSIIERHPLIGEVFDSKFRIRNIHEDKVFIWNRIRGDSSEGMGQHKSNLDYLIRHSYVGAAKSQAYLRIVRDV